MNWFSNSGLIVLLFVLLHHLFSEHQAWSLAKNMLLPPELIVMRQLNVLSKRRKLLLMGVLEVFDFYTDLAFPMFAFLFEPGLTNHWMRAWRVVPGIGQPMGALCTAFGFWLTAGAFVMAMVLTNLWYLWKLQVQDASLTERIKFEQEAARVNADDFFLMARYANMAMMPSVAALCEEMAAQRRWIFDSSKDAAESGQVMASLRFRNLADGADALRYELRNQIEQENQENAAWSYFTALLLMKVFVSNVVSIYFQGSLFSISFNDAGHQAKIKVLLSMLFSFIIAGHRCMTASKHLGLLGLVIMFFVGLFAVWIGLRMYNTFTCEDHLWNATTGCVSRTDK